jgi:uncharacterized protein (TIGR02145 family)
VNYETIKQKLKEDKKMQHKNVKLFAITLFYIVFTGLQAQTVNDIEGNIYKTVTIGTQVWMAENLKTTKYNDSTSIPLVLDNKAWKSLTTPAYCWYDNDETANKNTYGALYNWFTVKTGKLCPTGWHIPTLKECYILTKMGGSRKLKEIGLTHWQSPNKGATNETGFTALPGGRRHLNGAFDSIGYLGVWWSSSQTPTAIACQRFMYYIQGKYTIIKPYGFSVRCLQDF